MENIKNLEEIKTNIKEFLRKIATEEDIVFLPPKQVNFSDSTEEDLFIMPIEIKSKEPRILIGEKGQTLQEIQYLIRLIVRKKFNQKIFIDIDVNDYKKKKAEYLKEVAVSLADEVALFRKEKKLPLMPSYERRIIHMELSKRKDIVSESLGEGFQKEIIIKPLT